jgi:hypothetical protein
MALTASLRSAAKTIPVDNRRILRVGFRSTPWLPLVIRSVQGSRALQATGLATNFRQISIALSQKRKETLVRQVALETFLPVLLFHTLRRREKTPAGQASAGVHFLTQFKGAISLSLTYRERIRRFIPRFAWRCSMDPKSFLASFHRTHPQSAFRFAPSLPGLGPRRVASPGSRRNGSGLRGAASWMVPPIPVTPIGQSSALSAPSHYPTPM